MSGNRPPHPEDADARRAVAPVQVYPARPTPASDAARRAAETLLRRELVQVPPRDARCFRAAAGEVVRIHCVDGPQVGDLNLWNAQDLTEHFYSGKTRALQGSHLSIGDRLWSSLPHLRPIATVTADSLAWYGRDADGAMVHDVIGTRCDPYTLWLRTGRRYDRCCHSNLVRALVAETGLGLKAAEGHVHDVLNVFMCTGFDRHGRYIMKASPVRPGDFLEFVAEVDLLGALSACPGGDCGQTHSSDVAACYPLEVEILAPATPTAWPSPQRNGYRGGHGL